MNTKQVLYNALMTQVNLKKDIGIKYDNEVFKPAFNELKYKVKTWFDKNVTNAYSFFEYTGQELTISTKDDNWGHRIKFRLSDRKDGGVYLSFNNSSIDSKDKEEMSYVQMLCDVLNNIKSVDSENTNIWLPAYQEVHQKQQEIWDEYHSLKNAVDRLKHEIYNDSLEYMKQIGFELKQFSPSYSVDWDYDKNHQRVYKEHISKKAIRLQYGRSYNEGTYVNGFKVLGKKGNKYNVEVYRDNSVYNYNILEKKFETFINEVGYWEYQVAPKNKIETEERLAKMN